MLYIPWFSKLRPRSLVPLYHPIPRSNTIKSYQDIGKCLCHYDAQNRRWWKNWDEWRIKLDSWEKWCGSTSRSCDWDESKSSWVDWGEWKSSWCGWKTKWKMAFDAPKNSWMNGFADLWTRWILDGKWSWVKRWYLGARSKMVQYGMTVWLYQWQIRKLPGVVTLFAGVCWHHISLFHIFQYVSPLFAMFHPPTQEKLSERQSSLEATVSKRQASLESDVSKRQSSLEASLEASKGASQAAWADDLGIFKMKLQHDWCEKTSRFHIRSHLIEFISSIGEQLFFKSKSKQESGKPIFHRKKPWFPKTDVPFHQEDPLWKPSPSGESESRGGPWPNGGVAWGFFEELEPGNLNYGDM